MAREVLHESWYVTTRRSLRLGSTLILSWYSRSAVNSVMCTIFVEAAFSNRVPVMGDTGTSRKSAGPFHVSMYWFTRRHMWPHSPPSIHFTPRRFASAYIFAFRRLAMSLAVKKPKLPPSDAYVDSV